MKCVQGAIVATVLALTSACSTDPTKIQPPQQPQWKEVTRMENGTFVTYQVPANQPVPNGVKVRQFDPNVKSTAVTAGASGPGSGAQQWGDPAPQMSAQPMASNKMAAISQDAETEIGEAEIAVRDLQARYETARTALNSARQAAARGDSASVLKYSKTAIALTLHRSN